MNIETILDSEELFGLHDAWNGLLRSSASDCVFLTHEWLSSWWRHLAEGRRLHVIVAREKGELIGILPLALHHLIYRPMICFT